MGRTLTWNAASATLRGKGHVQNGTPCQDKVFQYHYENGVDVVALADGAGSARYSHFGAELVVQRAADMLAEKFTSIFAESISHRRVTKWLISGLQWELLELAKSINQGDDGFQEDGDFQEDDFQEGDEFQEDCESREDGLREESFQEDGLQEGGSQEEGDFQEGGNPQPKDTELAGCKIQDLASTLLLVAADRERYIAIHLGDGVIGLMLQSNLGSESVHALSTPFNGEFTNETIFTTSSTAAQETKVYRGLLDSRHHSIKGFILFSDGPENSLFHKRTQHLAPACLKLIQACGNNPESEMSNELHSILEDYIAQHTFDDCSIAVLAQNTCAR